MEGFDSDLIQPLALADHHFLEVLVSDFQLTRQGPGLHLTVTFNETSPAVWNLKGRRHIRKLMADRFDEVASRYQNKLEAILLGNDPGSFSPKDPMFFWRWASAGALPVIRIGDCDYFCLFYRDIFPIGWNLANGACDRRNELMNPLSALERELGEELIVANPVDRIRYVLRRDQDPALESIEFSSARELWKEQFPTMDLISFRTEELPFKWQDGPDSVTVQSDEHTRTVSGCFVNINAIDFGIEIDRIARIALTRDGVLLDGEQGVGRVLNRPIGLFEVSRFSQLIPHAEDGFVPDRFFYCGEAHQGSEFRAIIDDELLPDMRRWRSPEDVTAFQRTSTKFDLCPVTSSLLRRYMSIAAPTSKPSSRRSKHRYDVFISFAEPDDAYARKVFKVLHHELDLQVFFAPETLPAYAGPFGAGIDEALQSASSIISIASSLEHLERDWVRFEMLAFHMLHIKDKNPPMRIISLVAGISPYELPMPQRLYTVLDWEKQSFEEALAVITTLLRG
jgi:hypothetical protein